MEKSEKQISDFISSVKGWSNLTASVKMLVDTGFWELNKVRNIEQLCWTVQYFVPCSFVASGEISTQ